MLESRRSRLIGAAFISLSLFVLLAGSVPRSGALTWEDSLLDRLGAMVEHAALLRLADLGLFGVTVGAVVATAFVAGFLVGRHRRDQAAAVVGTLVAAFVVEHALKSFIHREPFHREGSSDYSFPSGGAMFSAVLVGALFLAAETRRQRRIAAWCGAALVLTFGVALVVFGWHYPTDILAGWCATAVMIAVAKLLIRHEQVRSKPARLTAARPTPESPSRPIGGDT